ncbi:hypothetical protein HMPREF9086_2292 [Enterobacter hormaechei ATCC 49162]|nr:hypothetical protein HMPREF9086_2292 [Enterobacter hormaechei ATCC 49162]
MRAVHSLFSFKNLLKYLSIRSITKCDMCNHTHNVNVVLKIRKKMEFLDSAL